MCACVMYTYMYVSGVLKTIHAVIINTMYNVPCMSNCELVEPQHIQNTEEKSTGPV